MIIVDRFNALFPRYAAKQVSGQCDFTEPENVKKGRGLCRLTLTSIFGYQLNPQLLWDTRSCWQNAVSKDQILGKAADEALLLEDADGKKHFYLFELKSGFSKEEILSAKNQLLGSFLEWHSLFSLLQDYCATDFIWHGVIASFKPSTERLMTLNSQKQSGDRGAGFCLKLHSQNSYLMPAQNLQNYYAPLRFQDVQMHYIGIPDNQQYYQVDFQTL